jgi:hypothetical protein
MVGTNFEEDVVEEDKFPFCMKCRTEVEKHGLRFCPSCRGLVLYYTQKQITTFKNQKAKMEEALAKKASEELPKPTRSNIPRLLNEEEYNPHRPYQEQTEDEF